MADFGLDVLTIGIAMQRATEISTKAVAGLKSGVTLKGTVASYSNLPADPDVGDAYFADDTGVEWAWDGTEWIPVGYDVASKAETREIINAYGGGS